MANRFTLVPGSMPKYHAWYWEPAIDGHLLRGLLQLCPAERPLDTQGLGPTGENVPVLAHSWPVGMADDVLVLLGEKPSELANGRVPIWVCPACGDLSCGAVTAVVEQMPDEVVWRDFRWDTGDDCEDDGESGVLGGPFVFDRPQYEAELRRFVETFETVRTSLSVHLVQAEEVQGPRPRSRWAWPVR